MHCFRQAITVSELFMKKEIDPARRVQSRFKKEESDHLSEIFKVWMQARRFIDIMTVLFEWMKKARLNYWAAWRQNVQLGEWWTKVGRLSVCKPILHQKCAWTSLPLPPDFNTSNLKPDKWWNGVAEQFQCQISARKFVMLDKEKCCSNSCHGSTMGNTIKGAVVGMLEDEWMTRTFSNWNFTRCSICAAPEKETKESEVKLSESTKCQARVARIETKEVFRTRQGICRCWIFVDIEPLILKRWRFKLASFQGLLKIGSNECGKCAIW